MAARWTSSLWLTPPPLWVSTTTAYRELMAFGAWRSSSRWPITFLLRCWATHPPTKDRKSTRLNSSHDQTSYAVFCLKKKIQTACLIMEGAEFTENIINGVERPVKAAELFAFTLRVRAGNTDVLTDAEENVRQKLRAEGVM